MIEQLKLLKLQCPCLMVNFNLTADEKTQLSYLQQIEQAAVLAQTLNPEKPPILETVLGGNPNAWEKQNSLMVDNLQRWAEKAQSWRCEIAIKAHVRSAVNSPERLLWLVEQVASKAVLVAYDYSHFELQGIGLRDSMSAIIPMAKFIHVKDTSGDVDKFEFLLPGSGRTDYQQYFSLLREFSYAGPVCVEVSSQVFNKPGYDPIKAAQASFDALNSALSKAFLG
ncbi:MAG: TIM barrel protein [Pirellulales bacterium]